MTKYEYLIEMAEYCQTVAERAADARVAKFHDDAAKAFHNRAMNMSVVEASEILSSHVQPYFVQQKAAEFNPFRQVYPLPPQYISAYGGAK